MAVVINELEVTTSPPARAEGGAAQPATRQGPPTLMPDMEREIEKTFHKKQERLHRLTAC